MMARNALIREFVKNNLPIYKLFTFVKKYLTMENLSPEILGSFKSALNKLTGFHRRAYAAELCELYFDNSARKMERGLGIGRETIKLGQNERNSGIRCEGAYPLRGAKKKNCSTLP
jgi:hypothetical protein